MNLIKKLTILILFTSYVYGFNVNAKCIERLTPNLNSTLKQLNKYSCINSVYRKNLAWTCNKNAPKGWAKYYGSKIKNLEKKKEICSS